MDMEGGELTAAATFAILDVFSPSIGSSTRNGVGFGIGTALTGGIPLRERHHLQDRLLQRHLLQRQLNRSLNSRL